MGRKLAIIWHASFSILAGIGFYFAVLPRTPELMGQVSHGLGTTARIGCGILVGLTALPVVFTLLRTRNAESGTPKPALTLQTGSIVAHLLAAVLIVGTAVSEIWLRLDAVGQWLFGVYGGAAAIALLGVFAFYLSLVAELPPRPPKPKKDKQRRGKATESTEGAEAAAAADNDEVDAIGDTEDAGTEAAEAGAVEEAQSEPAASGASEAPEVPETDDLPTAEDTVAVEAPRGGLRNRRPSGKSGGSRRRRRSRGGIALDD
jgi:hypothetical protein